MVGFLNNWYDEPESCQQELVNASEVAAVCGECVKWGGEKKLFKLLSLNNISGRESATPDTGASFSDFSCGIKRGSFFKVAERTEAICCA